MGLIEKKEEIKRQQQIQLYDDNKSNVCYLPAGPLGITPSLSSVIETETENEGVSLTKAQRPKIQTEKHNKNT